MSALDKFYNDIEHAVVCSGFGSINRAGVSFIIGEYVAKYTQKTIQSLYTDELTAVTAAQQTRIAELETLLRLSDADLNKARLWLMRTERIAKEAASAVPVAHMDKADGTLQWLPHTQTVKPGDYLYLRGPFAPAQESGK